MQSNFALGAAIVSGVLFASAVATAAPVGLNTPRPGGKDVRVQGATNISGWAVVDVDGTLARKENAKTATKLGTGTYEVIFNSALNHCSYQATAATPGVTSAPSGFVSLSPRAGNNRGVFIQTRNTAGAAADLAFHLQVNCS